MFACSPPAEGSVVWPCPPSPPSGPSRWSAPSLTTATATSSSAGNLGRGHVLTVLMEHGGGHRALRITNEAELRVELLEEEAGLRFRPQAQHRLIRGMHPQRTILERDL